MTTPFDPYANDTAASDYVRRQVKRGALVAPPASRFYGVVLARIEALTDAGPMFCEHDPGASPVRIVQTYGEPQEGRAWRWLCIGCFEAEPLLTCCQFCDRRPSPGLRTVLVVDGCFVYVGRICRGCRPKAMGR